MIKFAFYKLLFFFFFFFLSSTFAAQNTKPYTPTDIFLLSCGESSQTTSLDGRSWDSDFNFTFSISNPEASSSISTASQQDPSVDRVPYMKARVINSSFTYTFSVLHGPKFIRLYFHPAKYSGLDKSSSYFSVTANGYTLLSNFSAYLHLYATASGRNNNVFLDQEVKTFVKEFIVTVTEKQDVINLTFTPSPSSFAFINGIEIVSMPSNLYYKDLNNPYPLLSSSTSFYFDNSTSLETLYRLNVGGSQVQSVDDAGMFRTWSDDSIYIYSSATGLVHNFFKGKIKYSKETPAYVAPEVVYKTKRTMGAYPQVNLNFNLTWIFSIDSGFNYLVRLHFCETEFLVIESNRRVFNVFINNMTADKDVDVILWSGGNGIPVYKDYVVPVPKGSKGQQLLWLALHPEVDVKPRFADAILNGIEIFKLNSSDGSLAGDNPALEDRSHPEVQPSLQNTTSSIRSKQLRVVLAIVGAVIAALAVCILALFCYLHKCKSKVKDSAAGDQKSVWLSFSNKFMSSNGTIASSVPTDLCRRFSIREIRAAAQHFDDKNIIGSGGFGNVYKGLLIEDGADIPVAIKRLDISSKQGTREFHTEIEMMSNLRHVHLVSLIGYCDDLGEMILVYDYMERGTLRDHLYRKGNKPLHWRDRLNICIGAAKGLCYLHTGAKHTIIHRDVKSTNILLDTNWVAKISDFGLSRTGPASSSQTHVSTVVRGSFGYVDPEYYRRQQLTEKSDIYSFGVVLLEVLCARPPVMQNVPKEQVSLVEWARRLSRMGKIDEIIDKHLKGDICPTSLNRFVEIALNCVADQGSDRPSMNDVVWGLEYTLLLQEHNQKNISGSNNFTNSPRSAVRGDKFHCEDGNIHGQSPTSGEAATTSDDGEVFTGSPGTHVLNSRSSNTSAGTATQHCLDKIRSGSVFSEIIDPKGR